LNPRWRDLSFTIWGLAWGSCGDLARIFCAPVLAYMSTLRSGARNCTPYDSPERLLNPRWRNVSFTIWGWAWGSGGDLARIFALQCCELHAI
jgi:hypothetical protein